MRGFAGCPDDVGVFSLGDEYCGVLIKPSEMIGSVLKNPHHLLAASNVIRLPT